MANSIFDIDKFDLVNLFVTRGANFALIAALFTLVSQYREPSLYINFGYYWGISLLFGGSVYGGVASTLVRLTSMDGGLHFIMEHNAVRLVLFLTGLSIFIVLSLFVSGFKYNSLLPFVLFTLGASLQVQLAIMSLLRSLKDSKNVVIGSLGMLLLIPSVFINLQASDDSIVLIFAKLTVAYAVGLVFTLLIAIRRLRELKNLSNERVEIPLKGLRESYFSFTALNIYAYFFVMIDFHLIREMLPPDSLSQAGFAKIYFDRFVIPILSLITGVVSLNVLRTKTESMVGNDSMVIQYQISKKAIWSVPPVCVAIFVGYYLYSMQLTSQFLSLGYFQVLGLLLGYIFLTLNNVYFDIIAVKFRNLVVLSIVSVYLFLTYVIYYLLIHTLGLDGWIVGVFVINGSCAIIFYRITKALV